MRRDTDAAGPRVPAPASWLRHADRKSFHMAPRGGRSQQRNYLMDNLKGEGTMIGWLSRRWAAMVLSAMMTVSVVGIGALGVGGESIAVAAAQSTQVSATQLGPNTVFQRSTGDLVGGVRIEEAVEVRRATFTRTSSANFPRPGSANWRIHHNDIPLASENVRFDTGANTIEAVFEPPLTVRPGDTLKFGYSRTGSPLGYQMEVFAQDPVIVPPATPTATPTPEPTPPATPTTTSTPEPTPPATPTTTTSQPTPTEPTAAPTSSAAPDSPLSQRHPFSYPLTLVPEYTTGTETGPTAEPTRAELNPDFGPNGYADGTEFRVATGFKVPELWDIAIDAASGKITATPPVGAKRQKVEIPVEAVFTDGSVGTAVATIQVIPKIFYPAETKIRPGDTVTISVNEDADLSLVTAFYVAQVPDGWQVRIEARTGELVATAPADAVPDSQVDIPVTLRLSDGTEVSLTARVVVRPAGKDGPREPTPRITPGPNQVVLSVAARTFDPTQAALRNPREVNMRTDNPSSEYDAGIEFRLYEARNNTYSPNPSDNQMKQVHQAGPGAEIRGEWARCVTDRTGECDFLIPASFQGKNLFVVQKTAADGAFYVDRYQWNHRNQPYAPEQAFVPGYRSIPRANAQSGQQVWLGEPTGHANRFRSLGAVPQSLANPPIEPVRKCQAEDGPKIALVMDTTLSVNKQNWPTIYRNSVTGDTGFLEALRGTGAQVAAFSFALNSPEAGNRTNYPSPLSVDSELARLKNDINRNVLGTFGGVTRWTSGLQAAQAAHRVHDYDQIVFVTDGAPNRWGNHSGSGSVGAQMEGGNTVNYGSKQGVEAAVYLANELKRDGVRIVTIGVGPAETVSSWNAEGQLKALSGPSNGLDYFGTDWDRLAATMRAVASQISCQIDIEVEKQVVDQNNHPLPQQDSAQGWRVDLTIDDVVSNISNGVGGNREGLSNAALSPNSPDDDTINSNGTIDTIRDSRSTQFDAGLAPGQNPRIKWFLTLYGSEPLENRADITVAERLDSGSGFGFLPGTTSGSPQDPNPNIWQPEQITGSYYEISNSRTNELLERQPMSSPSQKFDDIGVERKIKVVLVNKQVFAVKKTTSIERIRVSSVNPHAWSAQYQVTVTNTGNFKARTDPIFDLPRLPDKYQLAQVRVDGAIKTPEADGRYRLSNGATIPSAQSSGGGSRTWTVQLSGTIASDQDNPLDPTSPSHQCQPATGAEPPVGGLLNGVEMANDIDGSGNNWACISVDFEDEKFKLIVRKLGLNDLGEPIPLDPTTTDWKFSLYREHRPDTGGAPDPHQLILVQDLQPTQDRQGDRVLGSTEDLSAGRYVLIETKAPQGYELLANPVRFEVLRDAASQRLIMKILNPEQLGGAATVAVPGGAAAPQPSSPGADSATAAVPELILQVADVRQGDLPLTGSHGVGWFIAAGIFLLVLSGVNFGIRRRA